MSKTVIAFFSSDAREKYKGDVFRALTLPTNYGIHFRYQKEWIHPELSSKLETVIGQDGVIFYTKGNNPKIDKAKRKVQNHAIRRVIVKDVKEDKNLGTVNFYLELKEFTDCKPHSNTAKDLLPPYGIVSEINITESNDNDWYQRVSIVQSDFKNTLFYLIDAVRNGATRLVPMYSPAHREWFFNLREDSEYQLDISFYDTTDGERGLSVLNSSELATLEIPLDHKIASPRETTVFSLYTHSLQKPRSRSFSKLTIKPTGRDSKKTPEIDLSVGLYWNLERAISHIFKFGLFSVLAGVGIFLLGIAFDPLEKLSLTPVNWVLAFVSIVCIGASASFLFMFFNKK